MMRVSDVCPWLAALLLSDGANDMVSDECVACCGSGVAVAWQWRVMTWQWRGSGVAVSWQ